MFGWFESKSPLTAQQRQWIDERFAWLRDQFGPERLRRPMITPTDEFFPDRYSATAEDAAILLDRLCGYMEVDRSRIDLQYYTSPSADDVAAAFNPHLQHGFALGAFQDEGSQIVILLERTRLDEPHSVVSTLAHELGHVHLLADGRCDRNMHDHEPLTDLLVVYFGLGIFAANNALREINWRSGGWAGWSLGRQGYLNMPEFAYALALCSHARGEHQPRWVKYLRPDVRALFKTESKHLAAGTIPPFGGIVQAAQKTDDSAATLKQRPAPEHLEISDRHPDPDVGDQPGDVDESTAKARGLRSARSADSYFTKGTRYAARGEHRRAVKAFSRALELNPRDPEVWLHRAQSQLFLRQFSRAIGACSRSLEYDPDALAALRCRARAYLWRRQYAEALGDLNKALRIAKREPELHYFRGLARLGLGKYRQAISDLNRARRFAPTWADIYLARSRAYRALGKTKYAKADLAEAIRRDPSFADRATRKASLAGRPMVNR
jgi:tetratricopeptide (TPR) repeat protein